MTKDRECKAREISSELQCGIVDHQVIIGWNEGNDV